MRISGCFGHGRTGSISIWEMCIWYRVVINKYKGDMIMRLMRDWNVNTQGERYSYTPALKGS